MNRKSPDLFNGSRNSPNHEQNKINRAHYVSVDQKNQSPYSKKMRIDIHSRVKAKQDTNENSNQQLFKRYDPKQHRNISNNVNLFHLQNENNNNFGFKLPKLEEKYNSGFNHKKSQLNEQSATLDIKKKKRLLPLNDKIQHIHAVCKTKAGTNGKQMKINQDVGIIQHKLLFGLRMFCVCDGHGLNGHAVSAFIKSHLIKNLTSTLKKQIYQPDDIKIQELIYYSLEKTNQKLLQSDINTEFSGSTVVAVFYYNSKLFCFNVGDSRAILIKQNYNSNNIQSQPDQCHSFKRQSSLGELSKKYKADKYKWKFKELSIDQKPQRQDECKRIVMNGGRVQCQKDEIGQNIGPLRVWIKNKQVPGLAMTRSFGDKAGLKAGTSSQPEVIEHELSSDDKFMVIASDGVWQYLQNDEVMNIIAPFYLQDDIDLASDRVIKIATEIWQKVSLSRDDITIIIVTLNKPYR